jgi:hypothetical protein
LTTILDKRTLALLLPRAIELDWGVNQYDKAFLRRIAKQGKAGNRVDRGRLNRLLGEFALTIPPHRSEGEVPVYPEPVAVDSVVIDPDLGVPETVSHAPRRARRYGGPKKDVTPPLDTSKGVLAALNDRWRVVDGEGQWILESRVSPTEWKARSFHRDKAALLRCVREDCGEAAITALRFLPDYHHGGGDFLDAPRCSVCGGWKTLPQGGLPRHMFCIEVRKAKKERLDQAA